MLAFVFLLFSFAPSKGCNFCDDEDHLEVLKAQIIEALKLNPDNLPTLRPNLTEAELAALEREVNDQELPAEMQTHILYPDPCPFKAFDCYLFTVPEELDLVVSAFIRVAVDFHIKDPLHREDFHEENFYDMLVNLEPIPFKLTIYKVFASGNLDSEEMASSIFWASELSHLEVLIDPNELQTWNQMGVVGLHLVVEVEPNHHDQFLMTISSEMRPNILIESKELKSSSRSKRLTTAYCPSPSKYKGCCLRDFEFDLSDWAFILAPKRFNAFACRGDCGWSLKQYLSQGPHGKKQYEMGKFSTHCCHPSEYDYLKAVYSSDGKQVLVKRIPGMIARKCACA